MVLFLERKRIKLKFLNFLFFFEILVDIIFCDRNDIGE